MSSFATLGRHLGEWSSWTKAMPSEPGKYRWRLSEGQRVHTIKVSGRTGTRVRLECATHDVRTIAACGEWQRAGVVVDSVPGEESYGERAEIRS